MLEGNAWTCGYHCCLKSITPHRIHLDSSPKKKTHRGLWRDEQEKASTKEFVQMVKLQVSSVFLLLLGGLKRDELTDLRSNLEHLASKYGKSMAQICVNWAICHGTIPLVGIRSLEQARDTVGALGWKLEQEKVKGAEGS